MSVTFFEVNDVLDKADVNLLSIFLELCLVGVKG